jgi:hypothetical protein
MMVLYPVHTKEDRNILIWAHWIKLEAFWAVSLAVLTCLALLLHQELYSVTSVKKIKKL